MKNYSMKKAHSFHIPVMGIGFTIDSPLKVAHYGIDSVISLVDDILLEKIRKVYCEKFEMPYQEISNKVEDFRAQRITSYLNMMNELTERKFNEFKEATEEKKSELIKFINMLPDTSNLKKELMDKTAKYFNFSEAGRWIKDNVKIGNIDVNIMTKIDKENYKAGEKLPNEYRDAHAAIRGFANSNLSSSVVLSAGMNPRLYTYMENFEDFYPNEKGEIKKQIVLKVSDFRSALIQGKFFAKKGLWVSEYRIESGLNCGGHAFATDGYLMGPILQEFKEKREELIESISEILVKALESKNKVVPKQNIPLRVTAQGGVGTSEEHEFLLDQYNLDSVGWGTPFLLVPEAVSIDDDTVERLSLAKESDLYLSNISPLGVPFNSLKGNTKDAEKIALIENGTPGSKCPKQYLVSNHEYTERDICTASKRFITKKIEEIKNKALSKIETVKQINAVTDKSCICVGLGTASLKVNGLDTKIEGDGVSVCPGPNMAYFSKIKTLAEMVDHIYGRTNVIINPDRPNLFVKELKVYVDYLKARIDESTGEMGKKQERYLLKFTNNLQEGISYYQNLFEGVKEKFVDAKFTITNDLEHCKMVLDELKQEIEEKFLVKSVL